MLRKYFGIFFLFSACALLLSHNIIPHHHHDSPEDGHHHGTASEHHSHGGHDHDGPGEDDAEESGFLRILFSLAPHLAGDLTFTASQTFSQHFASQIDVCSASIPDPHACINLEISPFGFSHEEDLRLEISPHRPSFGLRAPPFLLS